MTDKEKDQQDKDWEQEMREVDRLLAKLPDAEPPATPKSLPPSPGAAHTPMTQSPPVHPRPTSGQWLGTWARVALGLLIGIGMTQWPYTHGCGLRLLFYLVGVAAVIVAGVWSSLSSWRRRLGVAHILSQLLIIWGMTLAAREILPRVGYAKTEALWLCPDVAPKSMTHAH